MNPPEPCSVCKEPKPCDAVLPLHCGHSFHTHCLRMYGNARLDVERDSPDDPLLPCPVCRLGVPVDQVHQLLWETRKLNLSYSIHRLDFPEGPDLRFRVVAQLKNQLGFIVRTDPLRLGDFPVFSRNPNLFNVDVDLEVRVRSKKWSFEAWLERLGRAGPRLSPVVSLMTTAVDHDSAAEEEEGDQHRTDVLTLSDMRGCFLRSDTSEQMLDSWLDRARSVAIRRRETLLRRRIERQSEVRRTRSFVRETKDILAQAIHLYLSSWNHYDKALREMEMDSQRHNNTL